MFGALAPSNLQGWARGDDARRGREVAVVAMLGSALSSSVEVLASFRTLVGLVRLPSLDTSLATSRSGVKLPKGEDS